MNKTILFISVLAVGLVAFVFLKTEKPLGIATNESGFSSQTTSQVTCLAGSPTTTLLAARQRSSVNIDNLSADIVYVCRSSTCSATSSFVALYPTSSASGLTRFFQQDNYSGIYTCRAAAANGLVNVSSAP